jgi:hypothetical protein
MRKKSVHGAGCVLVEAPVGSRPPVGFGPFYFELETFLDLWRRQGTAEVTVRSALERAMRTSLAMERVGQRFKGL